MIPWPCACWWGICTVKWKVVTEFFLCASRMFSQYSPCFTDFKSQNYGRKGLREASKSLYPPFLRSLHSASGEIIMDGASISSFWNVCVVEHLFQQKTDSLKNNLQLSQHSICVLFSQKNICDQSENTSEYISMLQMCKNNSLSVRKNSFQFQQITLWRNSWFILDENHT